mgnify:CR=1 FL=1
MDDMYPNDGSFYQPVVPKEIEQANKEEQNVAKQSLPIIDEIVEWFDRQIQESEKLTNIDVESKIPVQAQIIALQELSRLLELKKGDLQVLRFMYKK